MSTNQEYLLNENKYEMRKRSSASPQIDRKKTQEQVSFGQEIVIKAGVRRVGCRKEPTYLDGEYGFVE
jgi:hypothetical protein